MDLETFKKRREVLSQAEPQYRQLCLRCLQPRFSCYCEHVQRFDPKIKFVILIHPIEMRRRIATGRMSHLCLENSHLIMGQDYTRNMQVNELLEDNRYQPMVLYPSRLSMNLSQMPEEKKTYLFDPKKIPLIFVIDGTWGTARKTMHQSQNLKHLPRLSFDLSQESQFRVRKQPKAGCLSTIEAIHRLLDLLGAEDHHRLLHVFNQMVEKQLGFVKRDYRRRSG